MITIMIYKAKYVLLPADEILENGEAMITDGAIEAVGPGLSRTHPNESVTDLGECILLSGFVNAHSHVDYTLSRNLGDGLNFWDWINLVGFRKGKTLPREVMLASARLGVAELALSGVTCLGDSSFSGAAAEAISALGLRGVVYQEMFGQSMGADWPERCRAVLENVREMQAHLPGRVKMGLSPHAVYTSNIEVLRFCADSGLPVAMHAAETDAERDYCLSGTGPVAEWRTELGYRPMVSGKTPVAVLKGAGLLEERVCLAHCVAIDHDDIAAIGESGVGVAHCPRSNAFLGVGVAPVNQLIAAGAAVGIGTDSAGSCGRLDFFEEMRLALGLARARAKDAGVLTAKDILRMATRGGARAIGVGDSTGCLQPGMRADLVAIDLSRMLAGEDIHLAVLNSSPRDVVLTVIDGVEVVRDGRLVAADVDELRRELKETLGSLTVG